MPEPTRIPLLHDRHTHPMLYAAFHERGLDLGGVAGRAEALARVRDAAASAAEGWTIAHGWNSGRYPVAAADLAGLPPVVVFNLSLHGLVVNEAGRALLHRDDPEVAAHLDDPDWTERHLNRVLNAFARAGATPERLARFHDWLLAEHGVHRADEMLLVDGAEIALYERAGLLDRTCFWAAPELYEVLDAAARARVRGIKLFTDGAIGTRTAALRRPYRDAPHHGMLLYDAGALERRLAWCRDRGLPVVVHAIGDRAIDQAVAAIGAVGVEHPGAVRIEHAQLIDEAAARLAKSLGVHLCMQPNFSDDSIHYAGRLPAGDAERNNPFRMLIDRAGFVPGDDLVFGSDGMPHGVREALRQSLFPPHPGQVLTLAEFVAGYGLPDVSRGHVAVTVDAARRTVDCRIEPA